jgi:hypothetical protein
MAYFFWILTAIPAFLIICGALSGRWRWIVVLPCCLGLVYYAYGIYLNRHIAEYQIVRLLGSEVVSDSICAKESRELKRYSEVRKLMIDLAPLKKCLDHQKNSP